MPDGERRLAAVMFTDIVGYTALTQSNEAQAMEVLDRHNRLLRPFFPRFHGREVKTIGDSFLVEFESALDALRCATEIQSYLHDYNVSSKEDWKIKLRIGIHLGDVIHQGVDVFGDAVNIANRIEQVAGPEGICISQQVYDQVQNKFDIPLVSLGEKALKNVSKPVQVYSVQMSWEQPTSSKDAATLPRDRIAILPFANMSPDPSDQYFADGMTEEIISTASGISGLSVISRTSVMGYKGTTKNLRQIGQELEVGSVLEGSFRKAGNKIRVTAQLIDVTSDRHLWAQNYDRNLEDVFEVQGDVARQVAEALRVKILTPELKRIERKPTESAAAYTLYLRGRSIWNKRGPEHMKKAMEYFEKSVKEDPAFALGYVGLADCAVLIASNWFIDREENLAMAKAMLEKALQLDSALAEAHATLGMVYYDEYDLGGAENEFKKAIELKPSYATAHQWYHILMRAELRWDEALKEIEKAVELDPLSGVIISNFGLYYLRKRDFSNAVEKFRIAAELGYDAAHYWLAEAYGMMKMFGQMDKELEADVRLYHDIVPKERTYDDLLSAYLRGDKETVRRLLPELEAHSEEPGTTATSISRYHFYLGHNDKGFEWLDRAYSRRESVLLYIQSDWVLDGVHNDPRYLDLLKRLGLN